MADGAGSADGLEPCATEDGREGGTPGAGNNDYCLAWPLLYADIRTVEGLSAKGKPLGDGGFYDNLGLVELFRRGCTRIYCVDASGDIPPAATTLAGALTRAYQELGVTTNLADNTRSTATAGSGGALSPKDPLAALNARLSQTGIITGKFKYPRCGQAPNQDGLLVVAKASLWPRLPYPLLAYAHDTPTFPHDSTADQWFDDHQYAAYTELGRCLGDAAAEAMDDLCTDAMDRL